MEGDEADQATAVKVANSETRKSNALVCNLFVGAESNETFRGSKKPNAIMYLSCENKLVG